MDIDGEVAEAGGARHSYREALSALNSLPDSCVLDLEQLATRIGADKLELIQWMRADIRLARLLASKLATERVHDES